MELGNGAVPRTDTEGPNENGAGVIVPGGITKWLETYARGNDNSTPFDEYVDLGELDDIIAVTSGEFANLEHETLVKERYKQRKADEEARRRLVDEEAAAARGPRVKRTAREYVLVEKPAIIMERALAAEVNLLGGPTEAGKSLLARDWAMSVAAGVPWLDHPVGQARNVLWIASEGTHDFEERWQTHPLWDRAADSLYVLDETVNLTSDGDVEWLLEEYQEERPGLVVFDVIYGMGMADDNGVKDVNPVIGAMKKISAQWGAATLALGHPPLGDPPPRRFRGSGMWRQLAYTEWQMGAGRLTCEKNKLADKTQLGKTYISAYPHIQWVSEGANLAHLSGTVRDRNALITADIAAYPESSDSERARRLSDLMGLSVDRARKLIKEHKGSH